MIPSALFPIALVLGTLKLCGTIALSWWWIALIWPIAPTVIVLLATGTVVALDAR